jgi:cephalosporin-C deacetylase
MVLTDLPEPELRAYRSSQTDPPDFDTFWASTLAETRAFPLEVSVTPVDSGLRTVDVFDVTFPGYGGHPVKAWLRLPVGVAEPLPAVVEFVGYGGGRGHAVEKLFWASAGFAHFQMDTRGQGSSWSPGETPDPEGSAPSGPGLMTRGIENPETYYYRRLMTDAVRAVEAVRSLPAVDPARVSVLGFSQGGGLALAVAGLETGLHAVFPFVPFLCDFPRAIMITDNDPYREIGRYLAVHRGKAAAVRNTLAYFDGVNFAKRATAPAWFSTALMDSTCPPSTVFAAFAEYRGDKQITVWPYNGHEGGQIEDELGARAVLRRASPAGPSSS